MRIVSNDVEPWLVEDGAVRFTLHLDPVLHLSTVAMRDAVIAGAGVALLPRFFVRTQIESGRLISWGVLAERPLEIWILHATTRLASTKIRGFIDFMLEMAPEGWLGPATAKV